MDLNFKLKKILKLIFLALHSWMVNYLFLAVKVRLIIKENRYYFIRLKNFKFKLQVSKVIGCGLKRIGDLSYEFLRGACGTYKFPQERILLCFSESYKMKCERSISSFSYQFYDGIFYSYDGVAFHNHADSQFEHFFTTLANYDDSPLAVAGQSPNTNKVEMYNMTTKGWIEVANYPYYDR